MAVDYSLTKLGRRDDKADPGRTPGPANVSHMANTLAGLKPIFGPIGRRTNAGPAATREEGNFGVMGYKK